MMGRRNFERRSGVIIDRCHEHGTWLDAHELERIAGFVLSGRAERAAHIEAVAAAERDREAARVAARRIQSIAVERDPSTSIFGSARKRGSPVETIFDLLNTLLT
jgi:hypothetical protein